MRIEKYQGTEERTIVTALIVNDGVLGRIAGRTSNQKSLFRSNWSNLIAKWCFRYYATYHKAPRSSIEGIFQEYAQSSKDSDTVRLVESFLEGLSEDYRKLAKETNEDYIVDLAATYFEKIQLQRLADSIQEAIENNDLKEARELQSGYESVDFSSQAWTNPFDHVEVVETFKSYEMDRSLVAFPGALGKFLSPHFERTGFVALTGPEKRGKSFWLQEIAWRALRQGRRILYYVLGDMSKEQVKRRLYTRATLRPAKASTLVIPTAITVNGEGDAELETITKDYPALSIKDVAIAEKKLGVLTATKEMRLKLLCAGGGMVCAGNMEQHVIAFSKAGWVPDLVILDYADELAPEPHTTMMDKRHQVNENWRILRRIALDYHCLVVTATQAATRAYNSTLIRKKDFSEDKRKNAHVTGLIGLNQFGEEHKKGIYRLNWVLLRDGAWSENQVVWTAGNLALGCPCIKSTLR